MRRKWIVGLVALMALGGTAVAAASAVDGGGGGSDAYGRVTVNLGGDAQAAARPDAASKRKAKPSVTYLRSSTPQTVDVGLTGPHIQIDLRQCPKGSKVVDGGVRPSNTNVFVQGSEVISKRAYRVLIGFNAPEGDLVVQNFTVTSHLTCIAGVK
jgi:hypothetical protein